MPVAGHPAPCTPRDHVVTCIVRPARQHRPAPIAPPRTRPRCGRQRRYGGRDDAGESGGGGRGCPPAADGVAGWALTGGGWRTAAAGDGTGRARLQALASMAPTTETDPAIAAKLVGMERYNPSNIDILEAFVDTQCASGSYDLDANLALLKLYVRPGRQRPRGRRPRKREGADGLCCAAGRATAAGAGGRGRACRYQFNPAQTNIDIIAKILIKALMQLPANDFAIYLQLLNDQVVRAAAGRPSSMRPAPNGGADPPPCRLTPGVRAAVPARVRAASAAGPAAGLPGDGPVRQVLDARQGADDVL